MCFTFIEKISLLVHNIINSGNFWNFIEIKAIIDFTYLLFSNFIQLRPKRTVTNDY